MKLGGKITICSYRFGRDVRILEGYVRLKDCRVYDKYDWFHEHLILEECRPNYYKIVSSSYGCVHYKEHYEKWLKTVFPITLKQEKDDDDDRELIYIVELNCDLPANWRY